MALFQSSSRFEPHAHAKDERCPLCEQPIARDIARRIEARKQEQQAAAVALARAEAAAETERKVQAARDEERRVAETAQLPKLAEVQAKLASLEQANQILQKEKDSAVLARDAAHFEDKQKMLATIQDLQRKLEGKSAHELGETSEVDLFEQLKAAFEGDRIRRVGKGVNGADVIHEVVNNGRVCGKIIYDAKNRNAWQNEFVNKLRADKLAEGADHAILASNKFPKGARQLHHQDGVIVASPAQVVTVAEILRGLTVRMHALRVSAEEREKKSVELYAFITSAHCKELIDSVDIQAGKMLELDTREQEAHRRIWDQRAKLIQAVKKVNGDLSFEIDRIIGTAGQ